MAVIATDRSAARVTRGVILGPSGLPAVRAQYDVTASPTNAAGGRKRRQARIETGGEEHVLPPRQRLMGLNLVRDSQRNMPQARGLAKTMRVNVVGSYGKLRFNATGPFFTEAQNWFNSVWARAADFLDGTSWRECLQLVVYAIAHEGDFVAVFDDGILSGRPGGTGRLAFWEADQICNLTEADFAPLKQAGFTQAAGVIFDRHGRKVGVICSRNRGATETERKHAVILTRDPDAPQDAVNWVHVRRKFRLRQGRGVGDAVTAMQTMLDSHEILGYELQTTKLAASRYATVYEKESSESDEPSGFADLAAAADQVTSGDAPAPLTPDEADQVAADALERYTGGNVDYMQAGDKVEFDPANRPNNNLAPFLDYTTDVSGAAFGLAHAYARMRADTSYTAFRGDMCMTWMTFADFQQFLEDSFSDWGAIQAIRWGIAHGHITEPAPEGWAASIAWQYPKMPAVDEQKEQAATAQRLKNGLALYRELIGPHWREHFAQLGEEIRLAREMGIPLSLLETVAGAPVGAPEGNDGDGK